eukprot:PhM_4_TR10959/c0_g1_i1/m.13799
MNRMSNRPNINATDTIRYIVQYLLPSNCSRGCENNSSSSAVVVDVVDAVAEVWPLVAVSRAWRRAVRFAALELITAELSPNANLRLMCALSGESASQTSADDVVMAVLSVLSGPVFVHSRDAGVTNRPVTARNSYYGRTRQVSLVSALMDYIASFFFSAASRSEGTVRETGTLEEAQREYLSYTRHAMICRSHHPALCPAFCAVEPNFVPRVRVDVVGPLGTPIRRFLSGAEARRFDAANSAAHPVGAPYLIAGGAFHVHDSLYTESLTPTSQSGECGTLYMLDVHTLPSDDRSVRTITNNVSHAVRVHAQRRRCILILVNANTRHAHRRGVLLLGAALRPLEEHLLRASVSNAQGEQLPPLRIQICPFSKTGEGTAEKKDYGMDSALEWLVNNIRS